MGDDIDDIKVFDAASQRSIEPVDEVVIYPAMELLLTEKERDAGFRKMNQDTEAVCRDLASRKAYDAEHHLRILTDELTESIRYAPDTVN